MQRRLWPPRLASAETTHPDIVTNATMTRPMKARARFGLSTNPKLKEFVPAQSVWRSRTLRSASRLLVNSNLRSREGHRRIGAWQTNLLFDMWQGALGGMEGRGFASFHHKVLDVTYLSILNYMPRPSDSLYKDAPKLPHLQHQAAPGYQF